MLLEDVDVRARSGGSEVIDRELCDMRSISLYTKEASSEPTKATYLVNLQVPYLLRSAAVGRFLLDLRLQS